MVSVPGFLLQIVCLFGVLTMKNKLINIGGMYMKTLLGNVKILLVCLAMVQVTWILTKHTMFGKCLVMLFQIVKEMIKLTYIVLNKTYKFLHKQVEKYNKENQKQPSTQTEKKVANGNNVIQLKPKEGN
jgi:multisubunit Na+/H+ antiporter MnhE subunit